MKTTRHDNLCSEIRRERLGLRAWLKERLCRHLTEHAANCPRCRKRMGLTNRVEIALLLAKTRPHSMNLLMRANTKTLGVLQHSLRRAPQSETLRTTQPEPAWCEKNRPLLERLLNIAACLFVVLMIRTGIMNSLTDYKEQGEAVIHNYYARNLDSGLFHEIFPNSDTTA
jgi:hypothetical protein